MKRFTAENAEHAEKRQRVVIDMLRHAYNGLLSAVPSAISAVKFFSADPASC